MYLILYCIFFCSIIPGHSDSSGFIRESTGLLKHTGGSVLFIFFVIREASLVLTSLVGDVTVFAPPGSKGCMAVAGEFVS